MILFLPPLIIINKGLLDFHWQIFPLPRGRRSNFSDRLFGIALLKLIFLGLNIGNESIDRWLRSESHQFLPHHLFYVIFGVRLLNSVFLVSRTGSYLFLRQTLGDLSFCFSLLLGFLRIKLDSFHEIWIGIKLSGCFLEASDAFLHDCGEFGQLS